MIKCILLFSIRCDTHMIARQNVFIEEMVVGKNVDSDINSSHYRRHVMPKRTHKCPFCGASMWYDEKLAKSPKTKPIFGLCCLSGTVSLPPFNKYPDELFKFITSNTQETKNFLTAVRLYNSILSFASVSAKVDDKLLAATEGVYTYRINGSVHHKISNFLPLDPSNPTFSQIYIYDSDMQSTIRTGKYPQTILANILNKFQDYLNRYNPYVHIYQQLGMILRNDPSKELNIVLKANTSNDKTKNTPTSNEIAALIVENNDISQVSKRDIVIKSTQDSDQNPYKYINETLSMYDPLAYPLIHLFGEPGNKKFSTFKILSCNFQRLNFFSFFKFSQTLFYYRR